MWLNQILMWCLLLFVAGYHATPNDREDANDEMVHFTHPRTQSKISIPRAVLEENPDTYFAKAAQRQMDGDLTRSTVLQETGYGHEDYAEDLIRYLQNSSHQVLNQVMNINLPLEQSMGLVNAMDYYLVPPPPVKQQEMKWNFEFREIYQPIKEKYDKNLLDTIELIVNRFVPVFVERFKGTMALEQTERAELCLLLKLSYMSEHALAIRAKQFRIELPPETMNLLGIHLKNGHNRFATSLQSRLEGIFLGMKWSIIRLEEYRNWFSLCPVFLDE